MLNPSNNKPAELNSIDSEGQQTSSLRCVKYNFTTWVMAKKKHDVGGKDDAMRATVLTVLTVTLTDLMRFHVCRNQNPYSPNSVCINPLLTRDAAQKMLVHE